MSMETTERQAVHRVHKPAILVIGHMGVSIRFLIDPRLKSKLESDGYTVESLAIENLTEERLSYFNTVILVQETDVSVQGDAKGRPELFDHAKDLLLKYVRAGGGLLLFFDEMHYTHEWDFTLNRLLRELDAEVGRETIVERDRDRTHVFPLLAPLGHYRSFRTESIVPHPVTTGVDSLWWPLFTGVLKRVGHDWQTLVTASETAETAESYRSQPPLLAVRPYGEGRVALFMGHSSFYVNNGYHLAYEHGWCLEKGNGYRLFTNMFDWLAEPSRASWSCGGYAGGMLPPLQKASGMELKPCDALNDLPAWAGVCGIYSQHSGGLYSVKQWAARAKSIGLSFLMFTDRIETRQQWMRLKEECEAASDGSFVAIPGVEFKAGEHLWGGGNGAGAKDRPAGAGEHLWSTRSKGTTGFAINIDKWPPPHGMHSGNYMFIDTLLNTGERYPGIYVVAQPRENATRPGNLGGFNAFEVASFHEMNMFSAAEDWFREIQAVAGYSASPVISHRLWSLDALNQVAVEGFKLYLYGRDLPSLRMRAVSDLLPGFVSNGPVVERFWAEGMYSDPWERFYLWRPGDLARIHLKVTSSVELEEIQFYAGERVVRRFMPKACSVDMVVETPVAREGPFSVTVRDIAGKTALSYAIPTRNLNYWNHVGSDRMNDYHNSIMPDEDGQILHHGQQFGFGGLVTFGYGWGDYCIFYHAVPAHRYHPQGYESGAINAGVANVRTYPIVQATNTDEQRWPQPDRTMPLATRDVAIIHQQVNRLSREPDAAPARFLASENDLTLFRYAYQPSGTIMLHSDLRVSVLDDIHVADTSKLALEMTGITYRGRSDIKYVSYVDPGGTLQTVDYVPAGVSCRIGKGGFVTLWPDRFGLAALFALDREMDIHVSGDVPDLRAGFHIPPGTLMKGRTFQARMLVCQESEGQSVEYWQTLRRQWGLAEDIPAECPPRIVHGHYLGTQYITAFRAEQGGVRGVIPRPTILPNNLLPVAVDGVKANWSAGAYQGGRFYAGGVHRGTLYLGLEPEWLGQELFLGNPLIADREDLIVEIRALDGGEISYYVHNPATEPIDATVRTSPAIHVRPFSSNIHLNPGEGRLFSERVAL